MGNHPAQLRSLIVTCLLSLVTLGIAATPALAKNERVYTAVFGGQVNKTKSQPRQTADKTAAEQAAAEQAADKAKVKAAEEQRAQEVAEAKITEAQAATKAAEEKTAIETEETVNNKKRAEEVAAASNTPAEEDVCTVASGDECQPGKPGEGPGQFKRPEGVAVNDATGDVYVIDAIKAEADEARVQEFNEAGEYLTEFPRIPATATGIAVDNCKNVLDEPCSKSRYLSGRRRVCRGLVWSGRGLQVHGRRACASCWDSPKQETLNFITVLRWTPKEKSGFPLGTGKKSKSYSDAEPNVFLSSTAVPQLYRGYTEHGDIYSGLAVDSKDDSVSSHWLGYLWQAQQFRRSADS